MKKVSYEAVILACLFFVGIFFSCFRLTESPSVWYDEGWYFQTSANLLAHGIDGIQLSPGNVQHIAILTVGYPLIYPLALWFQLFGTTILAARSLMVLFIMGLLLASYLFVRRILGPPIALAALALLVTFPPLYGNGKSVLGEVPGMMYFALFLLCFNVARSSVDKKIFWYILTGVCAGLCVSTKPVYLLLLPALAVGLFIEYRKSRLSKKETIYLSCAILVPMLVWAVVQFKIGTSFSEVFVHYANPYHLNNIFQTILSNIKLLFSDVGTLYTMFLMGVWALSIFFRLRARKSLLVEETVSFIFSVLVVLAYLRTGGLYRYLFYAQIAAIMFFPDAALFLTEKWSLKFWKPHTRKIWIACMIVLCAASLYQVMFSSWVANFYSSHKTEFWQEYFSKLPATSSVFFYDTPEVVPFDTNGNYYQFLLAPAGSTIGSEQLSVLRSGKADIVIARTDSFTQNDGGIFDRYKEIQESYKYSILEPR